MSVSMLQTIIPKSDQINYDDLTEGRTLTITITAVDISMAEQPVAVHYEGDGGKPYKPGKSMRRVMVHIWGDDAKAYVGRSMTLYGDPSIKFGGTDVGGIRISHMSHLDRVTTMALTETKAKRRPFTVKPLVASAPTQPDSPFIGETLEQLVANAKDAPAWLKTLVDAFATCPTQEDFATLRSLPQVQGALQKAPEVARAQITNAIKAAETRLTPAETKTEPTPPAEPDAAPAEATALIEALHQLTNDAAVVKWRFSPEVKRRLADIQSRTPAEFDRIEAAVGEHKRALSERTAT